ncbi:hypothetical protein RHMOL_Rhmol05G0179700 [Rhododendron molle]|uniref:Uncharacterized protein n=1 Tax=Rhododendron molle TaxID=49168 RepID=A0ACC0NRA7_RHOML|nr:hypothetical protein RHMOL_Rhmol05G0179700 [Rhododendron molle]
MMCMFFMEVQDPDNSCGTDYMIEIDQRACFCCFSISCHNTPGRPSQIRSLGQRSSEEDPRVYPKVMKKCSRLPHSGNRAVLTRSSQPLVGLMMNMRSNANEKLVASLCTHFAGAKHPHRLASAFSFSLLLCICVYGLHLALSCVLFFLRHTFLTWCSVLLVLELVDSMLPRFNTD